MTTSRRVTSTTFFLIATVFATACGSSTTLEDVQENDASLCLDQGNDVTVTAWFRECRPCTSIEEPVCTLTPDGEILRVETSSVRVRREEEGVACTDGCRDVLVECGTVQVDDGPQEIRHGDEVHVVTAPISTSGIDVHPCANEMVLPQRPDGAEL